WAVREAPADGEKTHRRERTLIVAEVELVGGELLDDESAERQVLVERANDVVAIRVGVGIAALFLEHVAFRVGVTGHIEPVSAPTLAVARRTEQSVHDPGKRFRRIVREKILDLLWRRRQAG